MKYFQNLTKVIKKVLSGVFIALGMCMFLALLLSFTDYPYHAYHRLGTCNTEINGNPDLIIILGGGGMPSPDGLIKAYYGANAAKKYPESKIIVAIPRDSSLHEDSPEILFSKELIMRGIDSSRILFERKGPNTFIQASNIARMFNNNFRNSVIVQIITSPEHMYRSVATFRKAGFINTGGVASFEKAISPELLKTKTKRKDNRQNEDPRGLNIRYNMWTYLKYEISVLREYCAIAYYKSRGWI